AVEKELLGQSRFASVRMRDDRKRSPARNLLLNRLHVLFCGRTRQQKVQNLRQESHRVKAGSWTFLGVASCWHHLCLVPAGQMYILWRTLARGLAVIAISGSLIVATNAQPA